MYLELPYVPHSVFQCSNSGYTVITKCAGTETHNRLGNRASRKDSAAVEVYDTQLLRIESRSFDSDATVHSITGTTVSLMHDDRYPDVILITVYTMGKYLLFQLVTNADCVSALSTVPHRLIVVEANDDDLSPIKSIIYRVPNELTDFVKLPKINDKMVVVIQALSQHLNVYDLITVIITLTTRAHHVLDYTRYCEERLWVGS